MGNYDMEEDFASQIGLGKLPFITCPLEKTNRMQ
jgi:hypothetical protein